MSETAERETEVVAGVVGGIIQKASDKWQIEVTPAGSQYSKKLWTKSDKVRETFAGMLGQTVTVLCNVSHWTNQEGKPIRSLWIEEIRLNTPPEATGATQSAPNPPEVPQSTPAAQSAPQPRDPFGDPTRASIERQVALKAAVAYYSTGPVPSGTIEDVLAAAEQFDQFLAQVVPF